MLVLWIAAFYLLVGLFLADSIAKAEAKEGTPISKQAWSLLVTLWLPLSLWVAWDILTDND